MIAGDLSSDKQGKAFFLVTGDSIPFCCLQCLINCLTQVSLNLPELVEIRFVRKFILQLWERTGLNGSVDQNFVMRPLGKKAFGLVFPYSNSKHTPV